MHRAGYAALALLLPACSGGAAPPKPIEPVAPPVRAGAVFATGALGRFSSTRFEIDFELPDGDAWHLDDHTGPWLTANHPRTASSLRLRTWTEEGRVSHGRCEERARLVTTVPARDESLLIEERSIDVPRGFDTHVVVGIFTRQANDSLTGFVTAFGGHGHRCFAYLLTTTAEGARRERVVGDRLGAMVEHSLLSTRVRSELEPAIAREPWLQK